MPKLKRLVLLVSLVVGLALVNLDVARAETLTLTNSHTVNYLPTFAGSHVVARFTFGGGNAVLDERQPLTAVFTCTPLLNTLNTDIINIGSLPDNPKAPKGFIALPEPASILLLGTGLMGVAAGIRSRCRSVREK